MLLVVEDTLQMLLFWAHILLLIVTMPLAALFEFLRDAVVAFYWSVNRVLKYIEHDVLPSRIGRAAAKAK